jgi:hypothetical protein
LKHAYFQFDLLDRFSQQQQVLGPDGASCRINPIDESGRQGHRGICAL